MKANWWLLALGGVGLAASGFVIGRQMTQNNIVRTLAKKAEAEARAAAIKSGTIIATPAGVGVVP